MNAAPPPEEEGKRDTIGVRLDSFTRWQKFCAYLGGGLGGLVLFGDLAKDSFAGAPHWMRALFITIVVASGISLGRSYFGYVFAENQLVKRRRQEESWTDATEVPAGKEYDPLAPFICYWIALVLGLCAAILLIIAAWQGPLPAPVSGVERQ